MLQRRRWINGTLCSFVFFFKSDRAFRKLDGGLFDSYKFGKSSRAILFLWSIQVMLISSLTLFISHLSFLISHLSSFISVIYYLISFTSFDSFISFDSSRISQFSILCLYPANTYDAGVHLAIAFGCARLVLSTILRR